MGHRSPHIGALNRNGQLLEIKNLDEANGNAAIFLL